jgi:hypothetical protein
VILDESNHELWWAFATLIGFPEILLIAVKLFP